MVRSEEDQEYELVRAITQRERYAILQALFQSNLNLSELARKTGLDRATVGYHLGILENFGIVKPEYMMLKKPQSKGKIGRYHTINLERLSEAISAFKTLYPSSTLKKPRARSPNPKSAKLTAK